MINKNAVIYIYIYKHTFELLSILNMFTDFFGAISNEDSFFQTMGTTEILKGRDKALTVYVASQRNSHRCLELSTLRR